MKNNKIQQKIRKTTGAVLAVLWILPLVGIFMVSVRPYGEVINGWWNISEFNLTADNYHYVMFQTSLPVLGSLWNSFFTSVLGALIPAAVGSMAAYAFARHYIPLKTAVIVVLLVLMAVPGQMIAIPVFKRMNAIGLLDSYLSVIIMNTVTALPWIIFFMMNFIKGQNLQIEEAARIDGASDYRIFLQVVIPQSFPALISVFILQFVWSWNSFFWPLIMLFEPSKLMATQVIPMLRGQFLTNWGALAAASILVMAVPLVMFMSLQKYYIKGSVGWVVEK